MAVIEPEPPVAGAITLASSVAEPLTRREAGIAQLLARGYNDRQIAAELVLSVGTVGTHVHHILQKLGVQSRHQVAARLAGINDPS